MTAEDLKLAEVLLKRTYPYKAGRVEYKIFNKGLTIWNNGAIAGEFFATDIIQYFTSFNLYFTIEDNKVVLKIF
jgi:hypothetical protein